MAYTATQAALAANAADLFAMVASGRITIPINQTYTLRDAAEAHRALEARRTTGSTVLTI
jgi:NADPH2:quinone reductase